MKKLPHDWKMPRSVEKLIEMLNEHGGICWHEHAVLIKAFFRAHSKRARSSTAGRSK